jgi:ADP-heptose:LPS heptosyltransferase
LPGVRQILEFDAPWVLRDAPPVDRAATDALVEAVAAGSYTAAALLTSSHQSPLPLALLLRLAGVPEIAGISVDHAGRLLDHRIPGDPHVHEVERALLVAEALGARPPTDDALGVVVDPVEVVPRRVVLHPGATAPARTLAPAVWRDVVARLVERGHPVVVTGSGSESELCSFVAAGAAGDAVDVVAGCSFAELATVLGSAAVVAVGNTGPMHLAAAMARPVVVAFAPTVPASRWAPWKVPHRLLGDLHVPCAGCRALTCPMEQQWCLAGVDARVVVEAVEELAGDEGPCRWKAPQEVLQG